VGVVAHCEGGYVSGLVGCAAHDPSGKVIKTFVGDGGSTHMSNFLEPCAAGAPRASPRRRHRSRVGALCHYGNISYRVGEPAEPATIAGRSRHCPPPPNRPLDAAAPERARIDLEKQRMTLGPWLEIDPRDGQHHAGELARRGALARARYLLHETQRPPFVIPDKV